MQQAFGALAEGKTAAATLVEEKKTAAGARAEGTAAAARAERAFAALTALALGQQAAALPA